MALLGLLDRDQPRLRLKRDYDTYFGRGRPLPFGQAYATLARLTRDGKAMVGEAEPAPVLIAALHDHRNRKSEVDLGSPSRSRRAALQTTSS